MLVLTAVAVTVGLALTAEGTLANPAARIVVLPLPIVGGRDRRPRDLVLGLVAALAATRHTAGATPAAAGRSGLACLPGHLVAWIGVESMAEAITAAA